MRRYVKENYCGCTGINDIPQYNPSIKGYSCNNAVGGKNIKTSKGYTSCGNTSLPTNNTRYNTETNKCELACANGYLRMANSGITNESIACITTTPIPKTTPTPVPISSDYFNAKIYPTYVSPNNFNFPELCANNMYGSRIPDINKVSIAISGGGSRSASTMLGYFRALNNLGYKNKAQYVSTVSGGSWFYGMYSFCQNN